MMVTSDASGWGPKGKNIGAAGEPRSDIVSGGYPRGEWTKRRSGRTLAESVVGDRSLDAIGEERGRRGRLRAGLRSREPQLRGGGEGECVDAGKAWPPESLFITHSRLVCFPAKG